MGVPRFLPSYFGFSLPNMGVPQVLLRGALVPYVYTLAWG